MRHRPTLPSPSMAVAMTALFDSKSKMFGAFANPGLPSMVLISRDGRILQYHEGLFPAMGETLKRELRESLSEAK